MAARILLIEDDVELARLLSSHLARENCVVEHRSDGKLGLACAQEGQFDLVICDVVLPSMNGLEVCEELRSHNPSQLILMLSSKDTELDMVTGLDFGADDYVAKPFNLSVLLARIRALLRRGETREDTSSQETTFRAPLVFADLSVDRDRRRVMLRGQEVELTAREFDVLAFLASNAGLPYTREQLVEQLWGDELGVYTHSINTHISRIRSKIEDDPTKPVYLRTVRGHGYRFVELSEL